MENLVSGTAGSRFLLGSNEFLT